MRAACIKHPYQVNHIEIEDFKDFTSLASQFHWANVPISQVREITFDPSVEGLVEYRTSFNDEEEPADIMENDQDFEHILKNFELKAVRNTTIPLSENKQKDVTTMLDKNWIPERYRDFYVELL